MTKDDLLIIKEVINPNTDPTKNNKKPYFEYSIFNASKIEPSTDPTTIKVS
jgi:hypothetical protein